MVGLQITTCRVKCEVIKSHDEVEKCRSINRIVHPGVGETERAANSNNRPAGTGKEARGSIDFRGTNTKATAHSKKAVGKQAQEGIGTKVSRQERAPYLIVP